MQRDEFRKRYREARKAIGLWLAMCDLARARGRPWPEFPSVISDTREPEYRAALALGDPLQFPPRRWRSRGDRYTSRVTGKVAP